MSSGMKNFVAQGFAILLDLILKRLGLDRLLKEKIGCTSVNKMINHPPLSPMRLICDVSINPHSGTYRKRKSCQGNGWGFELNF
jgi:hypothetical protein